jgi:hypothetical protein
MVVSARNRAATGTFPASHLAYIFRSASRHRHRHRFSSAAMIRSAIATSVAARSSAPAIPGRRDS